MPLLFAEDVEKPPADEQEDIARILAVMRQTLQRQFEQSGRARRDVHVKAHGCAKAEFVVLPSLPVELAQGLFAAPRIYPAFVRFSNSAPAAQPDAVPDGRGLALQVEHDLALGANTAAQGRTQDFVMANHPTFIARDVKDYLRLEELRLQAMVQPTRLVGKILDKAWNPLQWRWRALLAATKLLGQPPTHPANYRYYSMAPIRFGIHIVKYRVVPRRLQPNSVLKNLALFTWQVDGMCRLLKETLVHDEIKFDFQVQLCTSEQSMPVEDATVEWPESESPYRTVAELVIPRQDLSKTRIEEDERRAFNVWNALPDHRPLGGINRVRRQAYALSSDFRNADRGAKRAE